VSAAEEEKEKAAELEAANRGATGQGTLQKSDSKERPVISPISPGEEVIIIIIIIIITRHRVENPLCCNVTYQLFT
jgi:hypothetical protein